MDMSSSSSSNDNEAVSNLCLRGKLVAVTRKLWCGIEKFGKKLFGDNRRRIIHSMKVGTAITIVSLLYYFEPLYDGFGASALWAVITVVVVFEFHVGTTLARGFNRTLGTFVAGALGFCAHHVANRTEKMQPVLLGIFVFLCATGATFIRFIPRIKAKYDYAILIFILTFILITMSGYRDNEILEIAHERMSTILIGGFTSVCVCIFIYPVWAGDDLHSLISLNIEKLGLFLQGFGDEGLKSERQSEAKESQRSSLLCATVSNSKQKEDTLANFARWEPPHGQFKFRHPWKQYLKIGILTRQCAYKIEALSNYQLNSQPLIPAEIREACMEVSSESGKALTELASSIKTTSLLDSATKHIANSYSASVHLKSLLESGILNDNRILEIVPVITTASWLIDIVSDINRVAESVQELALLAKFKSLEEILNSRKSCFRNIFKFDRKVSQGPPDYIESTIQNGNAADIC